MTIKLRPWERPLPTWRCWEPDVALDAATAAADYAEWSDLNDADYTIVKGSEATICVRLKHPHPGVVECFKVSGEMVAQYHARPA